MVYCKLQINEIFNLKDFQKISEISPRTEYDRYSSHTSFSKFLHHSSINKTCSVGDINSKNLLVQLCDHFDYKCVLQAHQTLLELGRDEQGYLAKKKVGIIDL